MILDLILTWRYFASKIILLRCWLMGLKAAAQILMDDESFRWETLSHWGNGGSEKMFLYTLIKTERRQLTEHTS